MRNRLFGKALSFGRGLLPGDLIGPHQTSDLGLSSDVSMPVAIRLFIAFESNRRSTDEMNAPIEGAIVLAWPNSHFLPAILALLER